jgi:hypothetical protein
MRHVAGAAPAHLAAQHRGDAADAGQPQGLDPVAQGRGAIDVDTGETPGVEPGQMCDQCLCALGVGRGHRTDRPAAAEAAQQCEAAGAVVMIQYHRLTGLGQQCGNQCRALDAARARVQFDQRIQIAMVTRAQSPAGRQRNQGCRQCAALMLVDLADRHETEPLIQPTALVGGMQHDRAAAGLVE